MKKALSLALCLALCLSLFACSKPAETPAAMTAAEQTPAETATAEPSPTEIAPVITDTDSKSNGYCPELLPAFFPDALPDALIAESTLCYKADDADNGYGVAFYRLNLAMYAPGISALNRMMRQNGWTGTANFFSREDDTTGVADSDWAEGFWKQKDYAAVITDTAVKKSNSTEYFAVTLDIVPRSAAFPTLLAADFPAFEGVCLYQNNVYIRQGSNYVLTDPGSLGGKSWRWEFSGTNAFIGVTEKEAQAYLQALGKAGFITDADEQENSYGSYTVFTAEKNKNGRTYYAQFLYAAYSETLIAVYTNDYDAME